MHLKLIEFKLVICTNEPFLLNLFCLHFRKSENCVILNYIEELNSPELLREFEHGQKDLLERLKEFLIGKNGQEVKRMEKESAGARISHRREKVVICGTQEQTCYAATLIREKIVSIRVEVEYFKPRYS